MSKPNPSDEVKATDYNDLHQTEDLSLTERNLNSVRAIRSNPNVYNPGCWGRAQHAVVPLKYRTNKYGTGSISPKQVTAGESALEASETEVLATDIDQLVKTHNLSIGQNVGVIAHEQTTASAGENIQAIILQQAYDILSRIRNNVKNYDGWFDGNNLCQRSCQVNCQVGCQVACQGCNNGTCHNQKCGAH